ncbi:MAG: hypothetical protein JO197_08610 [Acidobacteria bacterium]|nr:hypothetical protein [Acidobacteriota bacterium]MBV9478048.1 hypothetical protein [Acidobacteriota bacterium]
MTPAQKPAPPAKAKPAAPKFTALPAVRPQAPAPAADATTAPPLTSSTVVQAGDSPMVSAAKRAVAARHGSRDRIMVDNNVVGRGHMFQANEPTAALPIYRPTDPDLPEASPAPPTGPSAAEIREKVTTLQNEQARTFDDSDDQYGNEIDEDLAEKRMTEIPQQIQTLQTPLVTPQATPPAPVSPPRP